MSCSVASSRTWDSTSRAERRKPPNFSALFCRSKVTWGGGGALGYCTAAAGSLLGCGPHTGHWGRTAACLFLALGRAGEENLQSASPKGTFQPTRTLLTEAVPNLPSYGAVCSGRHSQYLSSGVPKMQHTRPVHRHWGPWKIVIKCRPSLSVWPQQNIGLSKN